jgi:hypothetical protein
MNAEEARELLPWYAAGALSAAEEKAVEAQLRPSPILRSELDEYRRLKATVAATDDVPEFRPQIIEKTLAEIDALEQAKEPVKRTAPSTGGQGLFAWLREQVISLWAPLPLGGRLALASQFAIILVLGGVLIGKQQPDTINEGASGPDTVVTATGPRFTVVFQPEATGQAISALLESQHLEIVAGPSTEQMYVLAGAKGYTVDAAATLKLLRETPAVVRFADRRSEQLESERTRPAGE